MDRSISIFLSFSSRGGLSMASRDIRHMSEDELLDMDYFLNDDELDDDFGEEDFYII